MKELLLVVIVLTLVGGAVNAACVPFTLADWQYIRTTLGVRNAPPLFGALDGGTGNCSTAPAAFRQKYNCPGVTLATKLSSDLGITCLTEINQYLYNGPEWTIPTRTEVIGDMCSTNMQNFASYYICNPNFVAGCPDTFQVVHFSPFVGCLSGITSSMTLEQAKAYYANQGDRKCVHGKKDVCNKWNAWKTCPVQIKYVTEQYAFNCTLIFYGAPPDEATRCNGTLAEANPYYCYTDWWEENFQWVVAAAVVIPVMGIIVFFLYKMRGRFFHITEREILGENYDMIRKGVIPSQNFNNNSFTTMSSGTGSPGNSLMGFASPVSHPEAAVIARRVAARSKFKNVEYDPTTNLWYAIDAMAVDKKAFKDEKEAATYAYKRVAESTMMQHDEAPKFQTKEEVDKQRMEELVEFYKYWDPEKPNIEAHVQTLFQRHDIEHIARAVKTKYGLIPVAWEPTLLV